MRRLATVVTVMVWASACNPDGPAGAGSESEASTTGTTDASTTGTGTTSTGTDGSGSTTAPTTGAGSTTGEPGMCVPSEGPFPEDEFATGFASAICAQKEACGCEVDFGCATTFWQQFELVRQYAADNALHYDAACAGEVLAATVEQRGCKRMSEWWDDWSCWSGCSVFRGDVPSGGACSTTEPDNSAYSNVCAVEGEFCHILDTLTCEMYDYPTVGLGEECYAPDYQIVGLCEEGAACNFEARVCVPVVGEGEACGNFADCGADLWCDAQGTCQPRKSDGVACEGNGECASLECAGGLCDDFVVICRVDSPSDLLFSFTL